MLFKWHCWVLERPYLYQVLIIEICQNKTWRLSGFCHSCLVNAKNSNFANKLTTWGAIFWCSSFHNVKIFWYLLQKYCSNIVWNREKHQKILMPSTMYAPEKILLSFIKFNIKMICVVFNYPVVLFVSCCWNLKTDLWNSCIREARLRLSRFVTSTPLLQTFTLLPMYPHSSWQSQVLVSPTTL